MSRQMYWDEEAHQFFPVGDVPQEPIKPTNADRIRTMSDEELAMFFDNTCTENMGSVRCDIGLRCYDCWLDWLKKEVKE